ncbi:hypothetical protein [Fusobacterium ulcerans]|uniref:hypothetical protein n=1 Tax=Fusobacterium ulcerans TaxID=861 RepID=UPI0010314C86|nr:hypothetical protein [Fusobacterium ulcerans]
MRKDEVEEIENEINIYEIVHIFFKWKKIFLSIILAAFIASIITAYLNYENNKNILSIEFHIEKERFLEDRLFQKSGLTFPNLDIEDISKYIKKSAVQRNILITEDVIKYQYNSNTIEIRNLRNESSDIYFLESLDGNSLFNEKDKIFFEMEEYISDKVEKIIIAEEKKALENIEHFSQEMTNSTSSTKTEELRKTIEAYLEQIKILTGLKLQKKYKNMVVIDSISMYKNNSFLSLFILINFWGIITGILVVIIGEFWKRYSLRKLHIEVNYE